MYLKVSHSCCKWNVNYWTFTEITDFTEICIQQTSASESSSSSSSSMSSIVILAFFDDFFVPLSYFCLFLLWRPTQPHSGLFHNYASVINVQHHIHMCTQAHHIHLHTLIHTRPSKVLQYHRYFWFVSAMIFTFNSKYHNIWLCQDYATLLPFVQLT